MFICVIREIRGEFISNYSVLDAARNNALWCDAVGRAHGAVGVFHDALWLSFGDMPRFYPNAVTLTPDGAAEQMAHIAELAAARARFAVKGSFANLDLRPLDCAVLFEATWLARPGDAPPPPATGDQWTIVGDAAELALWEGAWAGLPPGLSWPGPEHIFPAALLAEPGVVFLAGRRNGKLVAGAVLNETGPVVGLSNVFTALFAPAGAAAECYIGAVALAGQLFPGRPLVGYERGDDLTLARQAGFQPIGKLRVWAR